MGSPDHVERSSLHPLETQAVVCKAVEWDPLEHKIFVATKGRTENMRSTRILTVVRYTTLMVNCWYHRRFDALSPTKLSHRGFNLETDSIKDDGGDKLPINANGMDSSDSTVEHRGHLSINISGKHSGDK
ncbi:Hypothetical predicted protein [Olea europaea subsp. europaea]|uniref:Uncharacterized protein n=1 Tax=Olea europaea subsp. europaea TaxID=158383 RepID=A0A8S0P657_OLEEU|nr:Hypothetical predicted protein [Olea europaea subsp. europaea]